MKRMFERRGIFSHRVSWFWLVSGILFLVLFVLGWPGHFFFLNDDFVHIPQSGKGVLGQNNSVRYIGDLSIMVDYALFKRTAFGYHVTNILLHGINILLLGSIARLILPKNLKYAALIIMSGFAIFGFHSEAIFWIIGRSATLGFLFFAVSILCLFNRSKSVYFLPLYFLSWLLALFSYESVWIWMPIISLVFILQQSNSIINFKISPLILLGTFAFFLGYLLIRKMFTGSYLGTYEAASFEQLNLKELAINYGKLLIRTIFPPFNAGWLNLGIALVLLLPVLYRFIKRPGFFCRDNLWLGMLFCWLISYIPYASLGLSLFSPESERFLYLPSAFFVAFYFYTLLAGLNKHWPVYILGSIIAFLFFHCAWFYRSAIQYQQAGEVVKTTYKNLDNLKGCNYIVINNLPATIYGLPTFRKGFAEGNTWLRNTDRNTLFILVNSTKDFENGKIRMLNNKAENGNCTLEFMAEL